MQRPVRAKPRRPRMQSTRPVPLSAHIVPAASDRVGPDRRPPPAPHPTQPRPAPAPPQQAAPSPPETSAADAPRCALSGLPGGRGATRAAPAGIHYVPKHASWLNMVEIEIGVL